MPGLKFFADVNIEKFIIERLRENGFDIKWALEVDKKAEDSKIILLANREERILITNDKDFGELVYRQKLISYGVILFRFKSQDEIRKAEVLLEKLLTKENEKFINNFTVISENKIRTLPLI